MTKIGSVEGYSDAIAKVAGQKRKNEEDWFTSNPPLKEFRIQREGDDYIQYGVWSSGDDFLVFYKLLPTSNYSFRHKIVIEKEIIRQLFPLL